MASCRPLEQLYQTYRDRVTFLLIYIAEAHPGQILSVPQEDGSEELRVIPLVATEPELMRNLKGLMRLGKLTLPAVVDTSDASLNSAYAGYPNRIYVIGADGIVRFKGAPGPTGFKVPDLDAWLKQNIK
jgi:hypothetical protein